MFTKKNLHIFKKKMVGDLFSSYFQICGFQLLNLVYHIKDMVKPSPQSSPTIFFQSDRIDE